MKYQLLAPMILLLFSFVSASYGYGNTSTYGYGNIPIPSVNTNWNATGLIINWSKVISSSSNETNWNANYSNFLLSYNYATNNTFLPISLWNSTNTSYTTWANILNGTMPKFSDLNQTNTSYYLNTNPFSFYNSTNFPQNSSLMTYANWNSTNTSYALLNGTDIFVGNNTFNLSNSNGYFDVINQTGSGASILFYINNSNGRIGIGNSSPTASFQVTSLNSNKFTTSSWNRAIEIPNAAVFKWTKGANNAWAIGQTGDSFYIMSSTADDASASVSYRLYISSTGQVGINTTSPQNVLNIKGGFNVSNTTGVTSFFVNESNGNVTSSNWINSTNGYIVNSSSGFTGTCTIVGLTSITVKGGIITSCS